jgi:hypothetical protein
MPPRPPWEISVKFVGFRPSADPIQIASGSYRALTGCSVEAGALAAIAPLLRRRPGREEEPKEAGVAGRREALASVRLLLRATGTGTGQGLGAGDADLVGHFAPQFQGFHPLVVGHLLLASGVQEAPDNSDQCDEYHAPEDREQAQLHRNWPHDPVPPPARPRSP